MRKKMVVIILSFIFGFIVMSGGYGLWQKSLIIEGNITVLPEVQVTTGQAIQLTTGQAIELIISE